MWHNLFLILIITSIPFPSFAWQDEFISALKNGAAYVESNKGEVLFDYRSNDRFIPASILKIATAACAIKELGTDYRFPTDFLINNNNELIIRGYGDPFMISEEMDIIAKALSAKGIQNLSGIILDESYFAPDIIIDGQSLSSNPYDAINGALVANFNTIYFQKQGNNISSAESQTPTTPLLRETAQKYANGKYRINLGKDSDKTLRYFGELMTEFLKKYQISMSQSFSIKKGTTSPDAKLIYQHSSSKTVSDVIQDMLKFSTNFIANQLFLAIGAKQYGQPATLQKAQDAAKLCLMNTIGWKDFEIYEGAGLSRNNRVTAQQIMILLRKFEPYRNLLPMEEKVFQAKTGTLTGVNTFTGYFRHNDGRLIRFVILVNSDVPFDYKFRLAQQLYQGINQIQ